METWTTKDLMNIAVLDLEIVSICSTNAFKIKVENEDHVSLRKQRLVAVVGNKLELILQENWQDLTDFASNVECKRPPYANLFRELRVQV